MDCPMEMEAILESNKTNGNPAFAGRAPGDECCWKIAILLRQNELNVASDHTFLQEASLVTDISSWSSGKCW